MVEKGEGGMSNHPRPDALAEAAAALDERRGPLALAAYAMGEGRDIPLPATLDDIAQVIGRELAVTLAETVRPVTADGQPRASGKRPWRRYIYIPRRMALDHPLVRILGWEAANKLQRSHTNMILEIPYCADLDREWRRAVIRRMWQSGHELAEIADWMQMHPRSIAAAVAGLSRENPPEETPAPARQNKGTVQP